MPRSMKIDVLFVIVGLDPTIQRSLPVLSACGGMDSRSLVLAVRVQAR
jgi:hypothetical protein